MGGLNLGISQLGLDRIKKSNDLPGLLEALSDMGLPPNTPVLQALLLYNSESDWIDNRTLRDYTGLGHVAKLYNSPCVTLNPTGSDDYIAFNTALCNGLGTMSFSIDIYITGHSTYQIIWADGDGSNTPRVELRLNSSEQLEFILTKAGQPNITCNSTTVLSASTWYNIQGVFNAGVASLYINGTLSVTDSSQSGNSNWATMECRSTSRIGQRTDGTFPVQPFRCRKFQIFNTVLTAAQRTLLAATGDVAEGLIHNYPMSENAGSILYDCVSSGASNGTLTNTTDAAAWANFQADYHYSLRYGATTLISTLAGANKFIQVGNTLGRAPIAFSNPLGYELVNSFIGTTMEGLSTKFDNTNAGSWVYDGVEIDWQYGTDRHTPKHSRVTCADLLTKISDNISRTVICMGTSLTQGGAWVNALSTWLNARKNNVTLINRGASGRNSAYALTQISSWLTANKPDCVFMEYCTNDSDDQNVDVITTAQAKQNTEDLIDAIWASNSRCEIFLMTMSPFSNDTGRADYANGWPRHPRFLACNQNYVEIVAERNTKLLKLIDIYAVWSVLQTTNNALFETYMSDSIHVNSSGYAAITQPTIHKFLAGSGEDELYTVSSTIILDHDYVALQSLPSGSTFVRNSVGTAFGSDGLMDLYSANQPRFTNDDHQVDPSLGLLLEQQIVNYFLASEDLPNTSYWSAPDAGGDGAVPTLTDNYGVAIDGQTTACRVQMAYTATGFSRIQQQVTVGPAGTYVFSAYMKTVDNSTKNVTFRVGGDNGSLIQINGTMRKVSRTIVMTAGQVAAFQIMLWNSTGTSTSGDFLIDRVEVKLADDSYIPTTTAAVTRNQDIITHDYGIVADECTIVCEYTLDSGSIVFHNAAGVSLTISSGTKIAFATKSTLTGNIRYSINGAAVVAAGGTFKVFTAMAVKMDKGKLKKIKVYNALFSDSELVAASV